MGKTSNDDIVEYDVHEEFIELPIDDFDMLKSCLKPEDFSQFPLHYITWIKKLNPIISKVLK